MKRGAILVAAMALAAVFAVASAHAAQPHHAVLRQDAPFASRSTSSGGGLRTVYGQPDLQGFWTNASLTHLERPPATPLTLATPAEEAAYEARTAQAQARGESGGLGQGTSEWHPAFRMARIAGRLRTSFIVSPADGQLPYRPEALARFTALDDAAQLARADGPETRTLSDRCLIGGFGSSSPPMIPPAVAAVKQIVQTRTEVAILSEMNHDVRIVRLGTPGHPARHPPANVRLWMGDSIGHWEGASLVVETTNFHEQEQLHGFLLKSPDARVTERFTRVAKGQIVYEVEVDDPATYAVPWRAQIPFNADPGPIYEFACHEGNYGLTDILAGARRADARAAAGAGASRP